jgi:hypothetical protein
MSRSISYKVSNEEKGSMAMASKDNPLRSPLAVALRLAETATPAQLFEWVSRLPLSIPGPFAKASKPTFDAALAQSLVSRCEPLIDLAVAMYCDDSDALATLWQKGDGALRFAIAGNPYRIGYRGMDNDALRDVLQDPDDELRRLVFSNPSMTSNALAQLYDRQGSFVDASDDEWRRAVVASSAAPVLRDHSPLDEMLMRRVAGNQDPHYDERDAFEAAWRLVDTLPPTTANANALCTLLDGIVRYAPPIHGFAHQRDGDFPAILERRPATEEAFVLAALAKWRFDNAPDQHKQGTEWRWQPHRELRTVIAAAASRGIALGETLGASDDIGTRTGSYLGRTLWNETQVQAAFARDGLDFLKYAVRNPAFHSRRDWGRLLLSLVDAYDSAPESKRSEYARYADREQLLDAWRATGERLLKKDFARFVHPDDHNDEPDIRRDDALSLDESLERTSRQLTEALVRNAVFNREWLEAQGVTSEDAETRLAPTYAMQSLAQFLMAALRRIAQEIGHKRAHQQSQHTVTQTPDGGSGGFWFGAAAGALIATVVGRFL